MDTRDDAGLLLGGPASETDRRRQRRLARLERELDRDKQRHRRLLHRYDDLRDEIEALQDAIHRRQRLIDVLQETTFGAPSGSRPGEIPKPQIAERILSASIEPMFPRQVRDVAVAKGWLEDDAASRNQLGVAMSKLVHKGRLVRGPDGRYTVPGREPAPSRSGGGQ